MNSFSLSHINERGEARMVDVSGKPETVREASASATIRMQADVLARLIARDLPKGDALATARIAAIQAAKKTSELIPMCHPIPLEWIGVEFAEVDRRTLRVTCSVRTTARTGSEMEALTGAGVAALTIYDMAKSADRSMVIGSLQLERKSGGKSGGYERAS